MRQASVCRFYTCRWSSAVLLHLLTVLNVFFLSHYAPALQFSVSYKTLAPLLQNINIVFAGNDANPCADLHCVLI